MCGGQLHLVLQPLARVVQGYLQDKKASECRLEIEASREEARATRRTDLCRIADTAVVINNVAVLESCSSKAALLYLSSQYSIITACARELHGKRQ